MLGFESTFIGCRWELLELNPLCSSVSPYLLSLIASVRFANFVAETVGIQGVKVLLETINIDASLVGKIIVASGVMTAVLNYLIASLLSEKKSRAFIYGLGVGVFLAPLAPFFLLARCLCLYLNKKSALTD